MRKRTVAAAAMAAAGGGLFFYAPLAAWADVVPAPDGTASSTAVSVGSSSQPIATVSTTNAQASGTGASSGATVVSVEGQPVLGTGGTSNNGSSASGALLSTGQVGPASAQVAPWGASSSAGGGSSQSASKA